MKVYEAAVFLKKTQEAIERIVEQIKKCIGVFQEVFSQDTKEEVSKRDIDTEVMLSDELSKLRQVDLEAVEIYSEVIINIKHERNISDQLLKFKKEHLWHIEGLDVWIKKYGGGVPNKRTDFTGALMSGYISVRGALEEVDGFLRALCISEELVSQAYERAVKLEVPDQELRAFLLVGCEDERKHITYIKWQLRLWAATEEARVKEVKLI